jgi:hypothetical protein
MRAIATEAGVSVGNAYYSFDAIALARMPVMRGMLDDIVGLIDELRHVFPSPPAETTRTTVGGGAPPPTIEPH